MARDYQLNKTLDPIRGMFWFPGEEDQTFSGVLHLEASKSALLETSEFHYKGMEALFSGAPKREKGQSLKLQGKEMDDAMRWPAHRIIHGHDDHGNPITLINCHSSNSNSTMIHATRRFRCGAAIFGAHMAGDDLSCDGIRLHFDHMNAWVGRSAFGRYGEFREDKDGKKQLKEIRIPVAEQSGIPLNLSNYQSSEFFCAWHMTSGEINNFKLENRVFLDLCFKEAISWSDALAEAHKWQWFFSLATRTTVDIEHFSLYRNDTRHPVGKNTMEPIPVWIARRHAPEILHKKRTQYDFYFDYDAIENDFSNIIARWHSIQKPWAAVLHRFFAVTSPRDLWVNEQFLFLAQAIESLHRARSGQTNQVDVGKAAKEAYLNAPNDLQTLLGKRGLFVETFRKSRNYWTHYGEPSPETDDRVLSNGDLMNFNEKLRWIVEAAILKEIGLPDTNIANVWGEQWKMRTIKYA